MPVYSTYKVHQSDQKVFRHFTVKNQLYVFYNCPQKEKVMQLYSAYNQFVFSLGGRRNFYKGNQKWELTEDTAFLLKRTAFHQELHNKTEGWKVLALYVKDDYFKNVLEEFRSHLSWEDLPPHKDDMLLFVHLNERIKNCYLSMLPYFDEDKDYPEEIIEMKFKELLYNIFKHPDNKHILSYVNAISTGYITPIWEVMESNFMFNLKLEEFAEISNRSLSAFKREFQDHYDTSPGKWLSKKRLERAIIYLKTTDNPVSSIAFDCGFNNASHFSRVFKDRFGVTPSEYKNGLTAE